jgi:hypothetical protein
MRLAVELVILVVAALACTEVRKMAHESIHACEHVARILADAGDKTP